MGGSRGQLEAKTRDNNGYHHRKEAALSALGQTKYVYTRSIRIPAELVQIVKQQQMRGPRPFCIPYSASAPYVAPVSVSPPLTS